MRTLNRVFLIGHLGRDAETKFTPGGTAVTKFSLATNRRMKVAGTEDWQDSTEWHNCVLFANEAVAAYLVKGAAVHVEGRLQTRSWDKAGEKRYATEVVVEELILLGGEKVARAAPVVEKEPPSLGVDLDDLDVPF